MARRVYTGREPQVFITGGIGHVEPGGEFEVPEELLEAYDRRPDITVPAAEYDAAEIRASRRRPGGKQSGGATATEEQ